MGTESDPLRCSQIEHGTDGSVWGWLTALAVLTGLALLVDASFKNSATYDEITYLKVAVDWWRTGDQATITRMGSPLTFWKLQQAPVLWLVDHLGHHDWIDQPNQHQQALLHVARLGCLWIWLLAIGLTAAWSRRCYGPRAMALAAWVFALSPNLIAHGMLVTMELPLVAATTAMLWLFWRFLDTNRGAFFWASACAAGLAFSCKFTAIVFPPIIAVVWSIVRWQRGERRPVTLGWRVSSRMAAFVMVMLLTNIVVTGFARIPLSTAEGRHPSLEKWLGTKIARKVVRLYETPLPQDWVAFATQMHHQASGGASYLWGERRMTGWWYYYFVALAVKVPLGIWLLVAARLVLVRNRGASVPLGQTNAPVDLRLLVIVLFLIITAVGSSRNYGMRYLLPLAPLCIVWMSALAESHHSVLRRTAVALGLAGCVVAIARSHPYELTYFNILAGGREGGRHILADSNLDWGQGLYTLARLQRERPEFRDLTFYYFGDTDPAHYGVAGRFHVINAVDDQSRLPGLERVTTPYVAVSASLQWGPWGPPGFFSELNRRQPVRLTDDTTIAIYRTAGLRFEVAADQ